jgi:hypothetical protein
MTNMAVHAGRLNFKDSGRFEYGGLLNSKDGGYAAYLYFKYGGHGGIFEF